MYWIEIEDGDSRSVGVSFVVFTDFGGVLVHLVVGVSAFCVILRPLCAFSVLLRNLRPKMELLKN